MSEFEMSDFEKSIRDQINMHCMENRSNTPDHILAMYLNACLLAFDTAVQQRETWYGRDSRPSFGSMKANLLQSNDPAPPGMVASLIEEGKKMVSHTK